MSKYNWQLSELEDSLRVCGIWHSTDVLFQAKQLEIDELLSKLNNAGSDLERLWEDKEQEIMILQLEAAMAWDNMIEQLSDAQQV